MDKIANYKGVIYKEAGFKSERPLPSNRVKGKIIDLDANEFRTIDIRDMKFHEKVKDNASRAYKGAKKIPENAKIIARNINNLPPIKKQMLGIGAGLTAAGIYEAKELLKNPAKQKDTKADKSRDKDLKNQIFRDAANPALKRDLTIAPSKTVLSAALIKPALRTMNRVGQGTSKTLEKVVKNQKVTNGAGLAAGVLASSAIMTPVLAHDALLMSHLEIKEMDRLKKRYLGQGVTKEEKKQILKDNINKVNPSKKNSYEVLMTPTIEEKIQEMRRKAKKQGKQYKKASEHLDELCKEASEKWTKQDKKGYLKNVAISAVQDFVNAGNPLNIGSSMVGSVMDSALLEKASMNLNKKIQRDQMAQNKLKKFNKAVEVKNGVAIPHAIDSKVSK